MTDEATNTVKNIKDFNIKDLIPNLDNLNKSMQIAGKNLTELMKNVNLDEYNKALESVLPQIVMFNKSMNDTILGVIKGTQENINTMNENMIALFEKMKTFHPKESDN